MIRVKGCFNGEKIKVLTSISRRLGGGEGGEGQLFSVDCDLVCFRFYRLVCYLVKKKWLVDTKGSPKQVKSPKRVDETPQFVSAKPGCSHWIDGELDP